MSRIFISHSNLDVRESQALKKWLIEKEPGLAEEIFLDVDPEHGLHPGQRWKEALQQATARCELVICLLSPHWAASQECKVEYRLAESLNKQIVGARLAPSAADELTSEWQRCDLFGEGPQTTVEFDDGAVTFATDGLNRLLRAIQRSGISALSFGWPPPGEPDRAPYRGWEPFQQVDAAVFFGRDAAIVHALDALRGMRQSCVRSVFVILGPSGAGKSSFLRAGLLPRLVREDRRYLVMDLVRPDRNALTGDTGLAAAIASTRARLGLSEPSLGELKAACTGDPEKIRQLLVEVRDAAAGRLIVDGEDDAEKPAPPTLILPLDQAEELFAADSGKQAAQFLSLAAELTRGEPELIIAATIRTDRFEVMQTHPAVAEMRACVFDDLRPMPVAQFKEVITGPAGRSTRAGRRLEVAPELVDRLIADAAKGGDTLPLLSLTLSRLYADYGSTGELTVAQYESMGGIRHIVQTEIDEVLASDPARRRLQLEALRSAFIPWLATINSQNDHPMRRVAEWDDLPEASRPLIDAMVSKRLMIKDIRDGRVVVEVALESLLRQWDDLAGWLDDRRVDLAATDALERAASAWEHSDRHPDYLIGGTRLADAERLIAEDGFRQRLSQINDYIAASRASENERLRVEEEHRQEQLRAAEERALHAQQLQASAEQHTNEMRKRSRILRAVLAVTAIVAVVAVVGFVQADSARNSADNRFREATSTRLIAETQGMLADTRPGGDARAFQQILAANALVAAPDDGPVFSAVVKTVSTEKIIGTPSRVFRVVFSPDGQRIASSGTDRAVRVWDAGTGQPVGEPLTGHDGAVVSVVFSPDGHRVASVGGKTIRVWDTQTSKTIKKYSLKASVARAAFSPDGHRLAVARGDTIWVADNGAGVWAGGAFSGVRDLTGHEGPVASVAFSPDGRRIATGGADGTVRLWDADTGRPIGVPLTGHEDGEVGSVTFSPDGRRLATTGHDMTVRLWDAATGQPIGKPLTGHSNTVFAVAFSPDGRHLISGGGDGTVRLWDAATGQLIGDPFTGHTDSVWSVAFSPDGRRIVSGSFDETIRIWDAHTGRPLTGHTDRVWTVAFSPDGRRLASGSRDKTIRLWDADTGQPVGPPAPGHTDDVDSVAFSPDGHSLATGSDDATVRLWDADTGQSIGPPLTGHDDKVWVVAFSPDGRRLASGSFDNTVRLWDADGGHPIGKPLTGDDEVWSVAFSPDGRHLASGGRDTSIRLWDAHTGQPMGELLSGHIDGINSLAFSPDGTMIASGSADGTVRLWNADSRQPIGEPLRGQDTVTGVAFLPDGRRLVSSSNDGTIRFWRVATGEPIGDPLRGHTGPVNGVAVSPDGRRIVSGGDDGTLRLWPAVAASDDLCNKLTTNMSHKQWDDWVSPDIDYLEVCPNLPIAPDD